MSIRTPSDPTDPEARGAEATHTRPTDEPVSLIMQLLCGIVALVSGLGGLGVAIWTGSVGFPMALSAVGIGSIFLPKLLIVVLAIIPGLPLWVLALAAIGKGKLDRLQISDGMGMFLGMVIALAALFAFMKFYLGIF